MLEEEPNKDKRRQLFDELNGPLYTTGNKLQPREDNAPSWWHGDEDAFETSQVAMAVLKQRR